MDGEGCGICRKEPGYVETMVAILPDLNA